MLADKYKKTSRKKDILRILNSMKEEKSGILIWQNLGSKRKISRCSISRIDEILKAVVISAPATDGTAPFQFEKDFSLFIHMTERSILFKGSAYSVGRREIILPIPTEMSILETRDNPRFPLKAQTPREVILYKEVGIGEKKKRFSIKGIDISQTGIALELYAHHLVRYKPGDPLTIANICGVDLDFQDAKVVYVCPIETNSPSTKMFKAGIIFSKMISADKIREIIFNNEADESKKDSA